MNSNILCVIIDDEIPGLDYIRMLCSQINGVEVVKCYNDPKAFLSEAPGLDYHVCLLDIQMPELNGIQLAQLISDKFLIFISAHSQFAADAFDSDAIDFIRKPVSKERLEKAIDKVRSALSIKNQAKGFYTFNTHKGKTILYFDEIQYITTSDDEKRDKHAYLLNGTMFILKNITLEYLLQILPAGQFVQINRREIVAVKAVQTINKDNITLKIKDQHGLPIEAILSETFRQDFFKWVKI